MIWDWNLWMRHLYNDFVTRIDNRKNACGQCHA